MFKYSIIMLFCFVLTSIQGQNRTGKAFFEQISFQDKNQGKLEITQDEDIADLVGIHIDSNKRDGGIDGFRIQLYLGSSNNAKREASEVKAKVLSHFPDEKIYVMYEAPFWRVQVGDFRSKNESLRLYKKLREEFPSCYPVPVNNIQMKNLQ